MTIKNPALGKVGPNVLVVAYLEGNLRSMMFMSSERVYATSISD